MHRIVRDLKARLTVLAVDEAGMSRTVIAALGVSN